jgi:RNA polymerase sigma-70 factor (ECF subfamily)
VTTTTHRAAIVRDFKRAWEARDIQALIRLLDPDATVIADGGGRAPAALVPIRGADHVADLLLEVWRRSSDLAVLERTVNGQPGLVVQQGGVTITVMAFDVEGDRVKHIWAVRNPDKLGPWGSTT